MKVNLKDRSLRGRLFATIALLLAVAFPFNLTFVLAQSGPPPCSNTLPTNKPCNVGRTCTLEPREDGQCGSYIVNNGGVSYPQCTAAEEGDHCVLASNYVTCGNKRACIKTRKQQPVEEYECLSGGPHIGYILKNVAVVGGTCVGGGG